MIDCATETEIDGEFLVGLTLINHGKLHCVLLVVRVSASHGWILCYHLVVQTMPMPIFVGHIGVQ